MSEQLPKPEWGNLQGHLKTITRHKIEVGKLCFKVGLYRQGLCHDLSKYSPTELITGARYYQGTRSPNTAEREDRGFSEAWLHHQGRNRHHFEYWIDPLCEDTGQVIKPAPMPMRYVVEMFCDRVAACKVYQGDAYTCASPLAYYERNRDKIIIHPDSRAVLEGLLEYFAEQGEDVTMQVIRDFIVRPRWTFGVRGRW